MRIEKRATGQIRALRTERRAENRSIFPFTADSRFSDYLNFITVSKFFIKTLDNICTLCYNVIVKRNTYHMKVRFLIWLENGSRAERRLKSLLKK